VAALRAQAAHNRKPVDVGQHRVEHDYIGPVGGGVPDRILAGRGDPRVVAGAHSDQRPRRVADYVHRQRRDQRRNAADIAADAVGQRRKLLGLCGAFVLYERPAELHTGWNGRERFRRRGGRPVRA